MIENVCKKSANMEGLLEDEQPFAQSLMKEAIEKSHRKV